MAILASFLFCGLFPSVTYEGTPIWELALSFVFVVAIALGIILVFVGPIFAVIHVVKTSKEALRTYRAAAAHVGLTQTTERRSLGDIWAIEGLAGSFRVSISREGRDYRHGRRTLITVSGNGQIPSGLALRAEGLGPRIDKALGDREVVIGDAGFDGEIYARGPEDVLRALCDARTRSLLRALVRLNGVVAKGRVRVGARKAPRNAEPVAAVLETALDAARSLVPAKNVVERIADLVRSDPEIGVREQCLMYLARAHRGHPAVQSVIREAFTMPIPELRVRAAIALGAEGRNTLLELVGSTDLNAECAADGIRALGEALSEPRCIEILQEALRLERGPVVRALVEALGLRGTAAAVAPLRAVIEAHAFGGGLRREAAQAIARIQSRLQGAEAGQVSIPDGQADAGQLSLANAAAGRVSLDQPEDARSSVPSKPATKTE
jgi:hypothetical protein